MNYRELYNLRKKELYIYNIEHVLDQPIKILKKKVSTFIQRVPDATEEEVFEKIKNDRLFAANFAIDPGRQNIGEKVFEEYLGVNHLPQSGKGVICFNDKGEQKGKVGVNTTKAVDFIIGSHYITQKYTGENTGGAQDNQFKDVVLFLTYGSINHKVCACVDGWYWEENGKKQELMEYFKFNKNVIICGADDIKNGVVNLD